MVVAAAAVAVLGLAVGAALGVKPPPKWQDNKTTSAMTAETTSTAAGTTVVATAYVGAQEVRLDSGETVDYKLEGRAHATIACTNGGGQVPSDAKKTFVTSGATSSTAQVADASGSVRYEGSMTAELTVPADFDCPPGQEAKATEASFTDMTVTDTTNGVQTEAAATRVALVE